MQFLRAANGGGGASAGGWMATAVRHFSRKRAEDVRRINPKVPKEEAVEISKGLLQILKDHGPLTVSDTWNRVKEAGLSGLNSKTHMKLLLKWMRGRRMLRLTCAHIGNSKKFYYSTKSDEDSGVPAVPILETAKRAGSLSPKKGHKMIKQ
ncbi:thiamine-phosphate synthase [Rhynchospora pubera]|uniref:Thiamine-phosphate synthase n=1 Tax=Rhynchospora pubera TaxID=906938 RepID=A0AAV8DW45_9POAL|nr:thiamine-phosphate synthase [Rhynchospora pubera]